ncbi:hypothetical protein OSB04_011743 [Centaurea solstitialis]|uniref:Uncharacterized protein n=1 Tax=Centaurea solstitialis TaxID=347529 RepID=A0AA38TA10_9ASTR|nr:hypothetical protein OSB04_011743 [Centaurea solstitialis]
MVTQLVTYFSLFFFLSRDQLNGKINPTIYNKNLGYYIFFYVDDTVFFCDWSFENVRHVLRILWYSSWLLISKSTYKKAAVYVIGYSCWSKHDSIQAWKTLCERFTTKLSRWNAKMLSIRAKLILLKSVLGSVWVLLNVVDIGERKLHWMTWSRVLASKEDGGSGVGSLSSFNIAMLFKWRCKFFHNPNALWVPVIKAIQGSSGRCSDLSTIGASSGSWKGIITVIQHLSDEGVHLHELCPIRVVSVADRLHSGRDF